MSGETEGFIVGAIVAALAAAIIPSTVVLGIEASHADKLCLINEGVEYVRGEALRSGKVVCNNGATFYYTVDKIREN